MTWQPPAIWLAITEERLRQAAKWDAPRAWGSGDCSSDDVPAMVKAAVLMEEVGEVARAMLEQDHELLRHELVQVAAVCVAWLESFDWSAAPIGDK